MTTHVKKMRKQYEYNSWQVMWLTGMTTQQFFELMFETGVVWLEQFTNKDRALLEAFLQEEVIWDWWANEWFVRDDQQFLQSLYYMQKEERLARYRQLHQRVFMPYTPPYNFLASGFNNAIHKVDLNKIDS